MTTDIAPFPILCRIKIGNSRIKAFDHRLTDPLQSFDGCHQHKIITAEMAQKIVRFAIPMNDVGQEPGRMDKST